MWQRNDTGHVQDVAAYPTDDDPDRRPFRVGPGEVVDFPDLLAGFTETDAPRAEDADGREAPEGDAGADESGAKKTTRKRAAAAAGPEGE